MKLKYKTLEEISASDEQIEDVKRLVFESLDMYEKLPVDIERCLELIWADIRTPGTECYNPLIAFSEQNAIGIICSFPADELKARQMASMLSIMRHLDRQSRKEFREQMLLEEYSVAPMSSDEGVYISRVAIKRELQGAGYGSDFLQHFLSIHPNQTVSLHVDRNNLQAIRYYQKHKFEFLGDKECRKLIMTHVAALPVVPLG